MSDSPTATQPLFAGRYAIERELGRGASSIVYQARDTATSDLVAIKVLRTELRAGLNAERFLREIRVTARLQHPHIVPVLDSGSGADGALYCVLPYMDGGTLRDRLLRDKQLPLPEAIEIGRTIASALAVAHEKQLVHRDVKPENILFAGGQPVLADFGIARALITATGESTTSTGIVRGTPAYMSPEQASGDRVYDGRSDLYSLACVVYEMIAGVPAFVGATSQSLVAQRLISEPRSVDIYRPSVPPQLAAGLQKALALAPADRYQTATQFAEMLDGIDLTAVSTGATAISTGGFLQSRSKRWWVGTTLLVAAVGTATYLSLSSGASSNWWRAEPPLDTTRIAILPFAGQVDPAQARPEDLIYEAMQRWRGITLAQTFEVSDAVRRYGLTETRGSAREIARRVGAGRYVRGAVQPATGGTRVRATIVDTRSDSVLHEFSIEVSAGEIAPLASYNRLADALALRGEPLDSADTTSVRNLPAVQAMIRARHALDDWNLSAAESLYSVALASDPTSARAALWTAQLRAWKREPRERWTDLALRAAGSPAGLTARERRFAEAFAALSRAEYGPACRMYEALTRDAESDFTAWFGLGQCRDLDNVVVVDPTTLSGWRFRSSYQRALDAYIKAFELLPSVYRSYEGAAYGGLRRLLYTSNRYRRFGRSEGANPKTFYGWPALDADTLAFYVVPVEQMVGGATPPPDPARVVAGIMRGREILRRITSGWATAFPTSPGAKEGLALSLEVQGDPAALETLRAALRLASDPAQRLRILGSIVWLDLKFGLPDRIDLLADARRIADSVLSAPRAEGSENDELLARFAAVTGRCNQAAIFSRRIARSTVVAASAPRQFVADVNARLAYSSLGCTVPDTIPTLDWLASRFNVDALPEPTQRSIIQNLFSRVVRGAEPFDTEWGARLRRQGGDYLITARSQLAAGHADSARQRLLATEAARRTAMRGDIIPDAALPEARVWLALGDTAKAIAWLDRSLGDAPFYPPVDAAEGSDNFVIIASMVRAAALRAQLGPRGGRDARRWARAVITLWDGGDADIKTLVRQMRLVTPD